MKVGDYVQMNVGKSLKGFVVERPRGAPLFTRRGVEQIWVLITSTPDSAFVGETHPFQPKQIEVLSENR